MLLPEKDLGPLGLLQHAELRWLFSLRRGSGVVTLPDLVVEEAEQLEQWSPLPLGEGLPPRDGAPRDVVQLALAGVHAWLWEMGV